MRSLSEANDQALSAAQLDYEKPPNERDPDDIVVHDSQLKRFPRVAHEPVERRNKVSWLVGGVEVLEDLGDNSYRVVTWHRASIEDLERLFYVIGELLAITQPKTQAKAE